jgi:hypothetical protein
MSLRMLFGRGIVLGAVLGVPAISAAGPIVLHPAVAPEPAHLSLAPPKANNLGGFNIVIVPGSGLAGNAPALAAFQRAAQTWAARISDPITVTIDADLSTAQPGGGAFPANVIGSTQSVGLEGGYDEIRNQMVADANAQVGFSAANNTIVAHLPTAAQFVATLPTGRSLSGNLQLTKANAKALGFADLDLPEELGGFGASDGKIVFNSAFAFDYDSSNGVSGGTIDFQTVATHEIGHALGFISEVDSIDQMTSTNYPAVTPTTLDLFRFSRVGANHPTTPVAFTTAPRDLVPGADDVTTDLVNEYRMSTGLSFGDGQQASHWKDDGQTGLFIGVMDPTLSFGVTEPVTDADFQAFDLMGYDVVPEPAGAGFLVVAAFGLLASRRRSRAFCA